MEIKDLEMQVAKVVEGLFNEKEESEIRRKTEVELQKSATIISDLTSALEDKNTEVAEYEDKLAGSDARIQELVSELEAAKKELETANSKILENENALEDIKKERAAEIRMAELEDAGVARSDRDSQMAKVKDMTDEEFASYKDELVSIREAVVSELEKAREKAEVNAKAEEEAKRKAEEEAAAKAAATAASDNSDGTASEEASEEDVDTPPAQITPGQAAAASLNMEYLPNKDLLTKYAKMGEAMAKRWKKSRE